MAETLTGRVGLDHVDAEAEALDFPGDGFQTPL